MLDDEHRNGHHPRSEPWYRRWHVGRALAVLFVLLTALFWIWALSPLAPSGNADRLDDPAFSQSAESICERIQSEISQLRRAHEVETPEERAIDVEDGTVLTRAMVAELEALPLPGGDDTDLVLIWLDDWHQYLEDRDAYVERLIDPPEGDDLRFLLTAVDGLPVDDRIGNFARVNDMDSCEAPGDV